MIDSITRHSITRHSITRHGDLYLEQLEQLATLNLLGFSNLMPQVLTVTQRQERTLGDSNGLTTRQQVDDASVGCTGWTHSVRKQSPWQQTLGVDTATPNSARQQKLDTDSTTRQQGLMPICWYSTLVLVQPRSSTLAAIGGLDEKEEDNLPPRAVPRSRSIALPRSQIRFVNRIELWPQVLLLWCSGGISMEEKSSNEVRSNSDMVVVLLAIHPSSVDTTNNRWPMKG